MVGKFLKARYNQGQPANLYFWRDNNGLETDLIFEQDNRLQMVEIKSGQTITSDTLRAGQRAIRMAEDEALPPWLIYGGDESYERSGGKSSAGEAFRRHSRQPEYPCRNAAVNRKNEQKTHRCARPILKNDDFVSSDALSPGAARRYRRFPRGYEYRD